MIRLDEYSFPGGSVKNCADFQNDGPLAVPKNMAVLSGAINAHSELFNELAGALTSMSDQIAQLEEQIKAIQEKQDEHS